MVEGNECTPSSAPQPMCMIGLRTPDLEGSQLDMERTERNSKYSKIGLWVGLFYFFGNRGIYLRKGLYLGVEGAMG